MSLEDALNAKLGEALQPDFIISESGDQAVDGVLKSVKTLNEDQIRSLINLMLNKSIINESIIIEGHITRGLMAYLHGLFTDELKNDIKMIDKMMNGELENKIEYLKSKIEDIAEIARELTQYTIKRVNNGSNKEYQESDTEARIISDNEEFIKNLIYVANMMKDNAISKEGKMWGKEVLNFLMQNNLSI